MFAPPNDKSILVVEDDRSLREVYRSALRVAGYSVVAVEDGADALRHLEHRRPLAVVLDLALPRVGGRDVHRELKARPDTRRIPVVVVSGTDISDLDRSQFAVVLQKPVEPEVVVRAVDSSIRRAGSASVELT